MLAAAAPLFAAQAPTRAAPPAPIQDMEHPQNTNAGIYAFTSHCAGCHDTGRGGATDRYALNRHTPEEVLASITTGSMAQYAKAMSEFDKRVVAVYVGGRPLGAAAVGDASQMKNRCESRPPWVPSAGADWNGWGVDSSNSRFQILPASRRGETPTLARSGHSAFGRQSAYGSQASSADGSSPARNGVRLRARRVEWMCTGRSVRMRVRNRGQHRSRQRGQRFLAYFGDVKGNVYAVDARPGPRSGETGSIRSGGARHRRADAG